MSSTYRSPRIALNVVSRTSRRRSLGPLLRKQVPAYQREASTVAEAETATVTATTTARRTNYPPPDVYNVPTQQLWKGKEATGLQDTLKHAHERELGSLCASTAFIEMAYKRI